MNIDSIKSGSDYRHMISLVNDFGEDISATAVNWTLFDETDAQVSVGSVSVSGSLETADLTIPAADNTITGPRGYRRLEVVITADEGTFRQTDEYLIDGDVQLVYLTNSFVTSGEAVMLSRTMLGASDIFSLEPADRNTVLEAAFHVLNALAFDPFVDERRHDNGENFLSDLDFEWENCPIRNIATQTEHPFDTLPDGFKADIKRAQIAQAVGMYEEAEADGVGNQRVIMQRVGESMALYSNTKPLDYGGLRGDAPRLLGRYMRARRNTRIGRA